MDESPPATLPAPARRRGCPDPGGVPDGAHTRRIQRALGPLLHGAPLSKSAVSRLVGRLRSLFADWRQQALAVTDGRYLYCDAIALKVRLARKVVRVPVLVARGVDAPGRKTVLGLRFPEAQGKALRTTNAIERLHEACRRRVQTPGALPDSPTAEVLLFGLLASGQIRRRRIDGWEEMAAGPGPAWAQAA